MRFKIVNTILLNVIILQISCGILWVRKHEPKAKFCYFDVTNKTIVCTPSNGGIRKINVFFYSNNSKDAYFLIKGKSFDSPVNKLELSKELSEVDTSYFISRELNIQIWNDSPVIFDYGIYVLPKDWKKKTIIYGWWNTR